MAYPYHMASVLRRMASVPVISGLMPTPIGTIAAVAIGPFCTPTTPNLLGSKHLDEV